MYQYPWLIVDKQSCECIGSLKVLRLMIMRRGNCGRLKKAALYTVGGKSRLPVKCVLGTLYAYTDVKHLHNL